MEARHARPYHRGAATRQRFQTALPKAHKTNDRRAVTNGYLVFSTPFSTPSLGPPHLSIFRFQELRFIQYPLCPRFVIFFFFLGPSL